jgi:hypothetical protein
VTSFGSNYKITASFHNGFSGFGIGDPGDPPSAPLPVELLSFSGYANEEDVVLEWTTTEEVNSSLFEVQRSAEGLNYQKIGIVNAQGNANTLQNYQFVDLDLNFGTYFYRLRMVDLDGTFEYSQIVSVQVESNLSQIQVYPNPTVEYLQIQFYSELAGKIKYHIYNLSGKKAKAASFPARKGANRGSISVMDLEPGIYILCLQNGFEAKPFKFYKSR